MRADCSPPEILRFSAKHGSAKCILRFVGDARRQGLSQTELEKFMTGLGRAAEMRGAVEGYVGCLVYFVFERLSVILDAKAVYAGG